MKKIIALVGFVLICSWVKSQTLNDPLYFNYSILPQSDFSSENGHAQSQFVEFNATLPALNFGKRIKLFNGFYYRNSKLDFDPAFSQNNSFPSTLHDIRYSPIVRTELNTFWESSNDFFAQIIGLANYAIKGNPNFKIGLGMALNNDFDRNSIIPIGALYYNSRKVKMEIIYPNANFLYKQSEDLEFGIFATADGAISRVSPFSISSENILYLRSFQLLIAPTISYRLVNNIFGHLKVGVAPIRNFETLTKDFKPSAAQDYNLHPSLFIRTGISFRLNN